MNLPAFPPLAELRILCYPDPVLKKKCTPVTEFGAEIADFAGRMIELMREAEGVGLAAPQVGVPIRLFVCNVTGDPADTRVFVNPSFASLEGAIEADEGCLSLPGVNVIMRRATKAVLNAKDAKGNPLELTAEDLLARVWQHESDHLDGRLIIDNMSPTDEIANRRTLKLLRE